MVPGSSTFLSASDAARELTVLARRFAAAFATFAERAEHESNERLRIRLATSSRVLGELAQVFAALVPESVLLGPDRAGAASVEIVVDESPSAEIALLDRALASLADRASPVADAAILRAVAHARLDLAAVGAALGSFDEPVAEV